MTPSAFRKQLKRDFDGLKADPQIPVSDDARAFEWWCASKFIEAESSFLPDPDDAVVGGTKDLGIDVVLYNEAADEYLICQCKSLTGNAATSDRDIEAFFSLHTRLRDPEYVLKNGNAKLVDALPPYEVFRDHPDRFTYRFVTTGKISTSSRNQWPTRSPESDDLRCELWGIEELKAFYQEAATLVQPIPESVTLVLPRGRYFRVEDPYPGLVAVLKTNAIRGVWQQHKQKLYAYNIRGYLGASGLNGRIKQTLEERASDFFYFNNGISAVCTAFDIENDKLEAQNFQIINGAQTLNAIRLAGEQNEGRVLLKLTQTTAVETDSGINADIIRFNNSQNAVKDSDFRSNDNIQQWLEGKIKRWNKDWKAVAQFKYRRKRAVGRGGGKGKSLKLEDAAKILYAWQADPHTVTAKPRSLFTDGDAGGYYEQTFGVDGDITNRWSDEQLEWFLLAVACYDRIEEILVQFREDDEDRFNWVKGHRWHVLALAGLFYRGLGESPSRWLKSERRFRETFDDFFRKAWPLVEAAERKRAKEDRSSWRNWRASPDEWRDLKAEFESVSKSESVLDRVLS